MALLPQNTPGIYGRPDCPNLPSVVAVCDLVDGDWSGLPEAISGTTTRAALIAAGMALAGERSLTKLMLYSAAGSLVVEAWVIAWVAQQKAQSRS